MVLNGTCTSWQEKTPCEYTIRSVSCACWLCHSVSQWSVSLALSLGIWQRARYKLLITVTKCLTEAMEGRKGEGEEGREEGRKEGEGDRRRKGGKKRGRDRLFLAHGSRGYSAPRRVRGGSGRPASAVGKRRELSAVAQLTFSSRSVHTPLLRPEVCLLSGSKSTPPPTYQKKLGIMSLPTAAHSTLPYQVTRRPGIFEIAPGGEGSATAPD